LQIAYKEIGKDLVPSRLFPSDSEYRIALEKYLSEHASHYIKDIGKNGWISLFEDKLLPEVREIIDNYQKKK
jgi:predicted house-cleaning noncanonical NTP pyrophosphatase (MazG superfamily)